MQRILTISAEESLNLDLGFWANSVRVDNPGNLVLTLHDAGDAIIGPQTQGYILPISPAVHQARVDAALSPTATAILQPATITFTSDALTPNPGAGAPGIPALPGPPQNIILTPQAGSILVQWSPVTAYPPVTAYNVRMDFGAPVVLPPSQLSYTIPGLLTVQSRHVSVTATNSMGEGPSQGINYATPLASAWTPIIAASQVAYANISGQPPDSYPAGSSPVWVVQPAAGVYQATVGTGIFLASGAGGWAVIDPQQAGNRTLSATLTTDGTGVEYLHLIHDAANINWFAVIFNNIVGAPFITIQQKVGGTVQTIGELGTNYSTDQWEALIQAQIVNGVATVSANAVNIAGTKTMSTAGFLNTFNVFPFVLNYRYFGFQLTAGPAAHAALQSIGLSMP